MRVSRKVWVWGKSRATPKRKIIITDRFLRASAGIPVALTIAERRSVKKVKLPMKPAMMPRGRLLPPLNDPDKTMGRMGRIQGERIVTNPPKKAKSSNKVIVSSADN